MSIASTVSKHLSISIMEILMRADCKIGENYFEESQMLNLSVLGAFYYL